MRARAHTRALGGWAGMARAHVHRSMMHARTHRSCGQFGSRRRGICHQRPAQPTLALLGNGPLAPFLRRLWGCGPPGKAVG